MSHAFAAPIQRELKRFGARLEATTAPDAPASLEAITRLRFPDTLVLLEPWLVSYCGIQFEPFPPAAHVPFHAKHRVYGIARSAESALWAKVDGPASDPLVCVRDEDEDEDDFEAIEAEGRLFRPLSVVLSHCRLTSEF